MQTFRTCPRRHYFMYEQGLRRDRDATALRIGGIVHKALERLWNDRASDPLGDALKEVYDNYATYPLWVTTEESQREWEYERETVSALVSGYWERWRKEMPESVGIEHAFDAPIRNPETGASSRTFRLAGKIDALARLAGGRLAVVEHKTTGEDISAESDYWRRLRIDPQISGYVLGARERGFDVQTVLYDVLRKPSIRPEQVTMVDKDGFKIVVDAAGERVYLTNKSGEKTKPRESGDPEKGYTLCKRPMTPEEWWQKLSADIAARPDFYFQRREIARMDSDMQDYAAELWQTAELVREAKTKERWVRNTSACLSMSRCEFLDICHLGLEVSEVPEGFMRVSHVHPELQGEVE
jgi:RecB family exonuclease